MYYLPQSLLDVTVEVWMMYPLVSMSYTHNPPQPQGQLLPQDQSPRQEDGGDGTSAERGGGGGGRGGVGGGSGSQQPQDSRNRFMNWMENTFLAEEREAAGLAAAANALANRKSHR